MRCSPAGRTVGRGFYDASMRKLLCALILAVVFAGAHVAPTAAQLSGSSGPPGPGQTVGRAAGKAAGSNARQAVGATAGGVVGAAGGPVGVIAGQAVGGM